MHHVASHILQRCSTTTSVSPPFVWISDALLNESIQRFNRGHLRRGSSVPGPLEARKRTSKRKNAGLASLGQITSPQEASVLLGCGQKVEHWQWAERDTVTAKLALGGQGGYL